MLEKYGIGPRGMQNLVNKNRGLGVEVGSGSHIFAVQPPCIVGHNDVMLGSKTFLPIQVWDGGKMARHLLSNAHAVAAGAVRYNNKMVSYMWTFFIIFYFEFFSHEVSTFWSINTKTKRSRL